MFYVTIDCGTTNARAYFVDENGMVLGKAVKGIGVKNTSVTSSKEVLRDAIRELITDAVANAGYCLSDVRAIFSSGMITSEVGLKELPHLTAPCDYKDLAGGMENVTDIGITDEDIPVYFIRGIKNCMPDSEDVRKSVGSVDFMRGEETQVMGLLGQHPEWFPATVIVLSSHTKMIPIDVNGRILGSLTTLSGQLREALIVQTMIGKSVKKPESAPPKPDAYFNTDIVDSAFEWIDKAGLARSLMLPRFMDVLQDTEWYERELFFDALIAAEDSIAMKQLKSFDQVEKNHFILIGSQSRCQIYQYIINELFAPAQITTIYDSFQIDHLSIQGALFLAEKKGLIN